VIRAPASFRRGRDKTMTYGAPECLKIEMPFRSAGEGGVHRTRQDR
jgi:hypothetical protein